MAKITLDSTRVVLERAAEEFNGSNLKKFALYMKRIRPHRSQSYWEKNIKKYEDEVTSALRS